MTPTGAVGGERTVGTSTPSPSPSPSESLREGAEAAVEATASVLGVLGAIALGVLVGIVAALIVQFLARAVFRRKRVVLTAAHPALRPMRFLLAVAFGWLGLVLAFPSAEAGEVDPAWRGYVVHFFLVLFIGGSTWLIASLTLGIQEVLLRRVRSYSQSRYRKVQTQLQVLNRAIAVVIWLLGLAAILMTFPVARTAGASVFASAGLISVVAGIAAQSTLGNLFAGLQLAFSDSIRVDDIIVWKTEYTKVEEITLTYVVLKVWDGRRLIVPSKELTSQTFENWTRRAPEMLGYVDLQVDWGVSIPGLRAELERALSRTDLWDGEVGIIQVREVESGMLHVSALVSAENPSTLIDLKFYVREQLVRWIQQIGAYVGAPEQAIADDEELDKLGKLRAIEGGGEGADGAVAGGTGAGATGTGAAGSGTTGSGAAAAIAGAGGVAIGTLAAGEGASAGTGGATDSAATGAGTDASAGTGSSAGTGGGAAGLLDGPDAGAASAAGGAQSSGVQITEVHPSGALIPGTPGDSGLGGQDAGGAGASGISGPSWQDGTAGQDDVVTAGDSNAEVTGQGASSQSATGQSISSQSTAAQIPVTQSGVGQGAGAGEDDLAATSDLSLGAWRADPVDDANKTMELDELALSSQDAVRGEGRAKARPGDTTLMDLDEIGGPVSSDAGRASSDEWAPEEPVSEEAEPGDSVRAASSTGRSQTPQAAGLESPKTSAAHEDPGSEESELSKTKTLPTVRIPIAERWANDEDPSQANLVETGYESSIFSGSIGAERRAREFAGPGEAVFREREAAARKREEAARKREAEYEDDVDEEWNRED